MTKRQAKQLRHCLNMIKCYGNVAKYTGNNYGTIDKLNEFARKAKKIQEAL